MQFHIRFLQALGILLLVGWLVLLALPARAQAAGPLTFSPVADAYVSQSAPNSNYGSSAALRVDTSPILNSYLRFNVSGVSGNSVSSAVLKIYANSSLSAGFSVKALADTTWTESGIKYANAPAPGAVLAKTGAASAGKWLSIDITPYVAGDGALNLALTGLSSTQLSLAAREAGATAPQLLVTLASGGGQPTRTPTSAPQPSRTPTRTPTSGPQPSQTPTRTPTATPPASGQAPVFSHVIVVIFENHEYSSIIGNSSLPNFNRLAQQNTLLTQFYAVGHPSLPNYIALTSGSTQGITSDCTSCFLNVTNLADQIEAGGRSWKGYMEDMPSPCFVGNSGAYVQKHNPFIYYNDIRTNSARCQQSVVPYTQLDADLQNNTLPDFAWITPNLCNDAHDCSTTTADAFLGGLSDRILSSPAWDASSLLVVTFDEGSSTASCCGLPSSAGGHIVTILVSPLVKNGFQDATPYSQYSLLKTIEAAWGLPYMGHSANAATSLILAPWK